MIRIKLCTYKYFNRYIKLRILILLPALQDNEMPKGLCQKASASQQSYIRSLYEYIHLPPGNNYYTSLGQVSNKFEMNVFRPFGTARTFTRDKDVESSLAENSLRRTAGPQHSKFKHTTSSNGATRLLCVVGTYLMQLIHQFIMRNNQPPVGTLITFNEQNIIHERRN